MESHQPQKNQKLERLPDGQPLPPRRFRIVKLEERIAPKRKVKPTGGCLDTAAECNLTVVECW